MSAANVLFVFIVSCSRKGESMSMHRKCIPCRHGSLRVRVLPNISFYECYMCGDSNHFSSTKKRSVHLPANRGKRDSVRAFLTFLASCNPHLRSVAVKSIDPFLSVEYQLASSSPRRS